MPESTYLIVIVKSKCANKRLSKNKFIYYYVKYDFEIDIRKLDGTINIQVNANYARFYYCSSSKAY